MKLDITDIVAEAPSEQLPDVIARVGSTPLMRLTRIGQHLPDGVQLYAKAEHLNPTGSVKDRAAKGMLLDGLRTGALNDAVTLIDATSGNTGISYAAMGAALGIRVTLAMPSNASAERRLMLQALGAELILTDPMEGTDGAQKHVRELVRRNPERYYYPDQYSVIPREIWSIREFVFRDYRKLEPVAPIRSRRSQLRRNTVNRSMGARPPSELRCFDSHTGK